MSTNSQENISLSNLSNTQRETLFKYIPVMQKLFLIKNPNENKSYDMVYGADVVKFLCTLEAIFGDQEPLTSTTQLYKTTQNIMKTCMASCALLYRRQFHGYSYLPVEKLENVHVLVEEKTKIKIEQYTKGGNLTNEEVVILEESIFADLTSQRLWLDEVNSFMKNRVHKNILEDVIGAMFNQVAQMLPYLLGGNQVEFYEDQCFDKLESEVRKTAVKIFQKNVPFKEEKFPEKLEYEVCDFTEMMKTRNENNKHNAEKLYGPSIAKYTKAITSVFNKEPMAEPYLIRIQHVNIQGLYVPIPEEDEEDDDVCIDDLNSNFLKEYYSRTDKIFQEMLFKQSQNVKKSLDEGHGDITKVVNDVVDKEITQIFKSRQIPGAYLNRLRQDINEQIEKIVGRIKDSTIANTETVENIVFWGKTGIRKTILEADHEEGGIKSNGENFESSDDSVVGTSLHLKIRLLTGKTFEINASRLWTVEILRRKFMKWLEREHSSCSLYYKTKKLRDEDTLQSYNIEGDFLLANV